MRKCPRCLEEKPFEAFSNANHNYCRACMSKWHFGRNLEFKRFIYEFKKNTPCVECGVVGNPFNVEFDHVKGEKEFNLGKISIQSGMTMEKLKIEIEKCEIRCLLHHRLRTHKNQNSWLWQMWIEEGKDNG